MRPYLLIFFSLSSLNFLSAKTTETDTVKVIPKHSFKCNMQVKYHIKPKRVDELSDFLSEGIFYGRIRFNNFTYDANPTAGEDYYIAGVGGNITYKSANFNGFGFTTSLYTSQNIGETEQSMVKDYKTAKDVLNRYAVATEGKFGLTTLGQAYLEYRSRKTQVKVGRFALETVLLQTHDTKMIPNTFEGVYLKSRLIPETTVQAAYIHKQKLRGHSSFHRVFAYADDDANPYTQWTQNDDGSMHRGITVSKLDEAGIEDRLIVIEAKNNTLDNITLKSSFTMVPELISSLILEGLYRFNFDELKVIPSVRYMHQFDNGAGAMGGANVKNNTVGYDDVNSLDGAMLASRVDFIQGPASVRLGYSNVFDHGDMVAPWQGFPTGGYTRAMSQNNWQSNTKAYMFRADYNFAKAGLVPGLRAMTRYIIQDFDDSKAGVQADTHVLSFDIAKKYKSIPNLHTKMRAAFVTGTQNTIAADNSIKKDYSYNEVRFEMNYLF